MSRARAQTRRAMATGSSSTVRCERIRVSGGGKGSARRGAPRAAQVADFVSGRCGGLLSGRGVGPVMIDAIDLLFLEVHREQALLRRAEPASLEVVQVVPAIVVERIRHHRRAEQVADLAARHADLELLHQPVLEEISLLDVHAIDATGGAGGGDREQRAARPNANSS